jgi:hypothetical protein
MASLAPQPVGEQRHVDGENAVDQRIQTIAGEVGWPRRFFLVPRRSRLSNSCKRCSRPETGID